MGFHHPDLEVPVFKKKSIELVSFGQQQRGDTVSSSSLAHNICLGSSC